MVITEHSLRPRQFLDALNCDQWPSSSHSLKCKLGNLSKDTCMIKALRLAKERPDIDELQLDVESLFDQTLRKEWSELLQMDRSWTLHFNSLDKPTNVTRDQVRNGWIRDSLAGLRKVKHIVLCKPGDRLEGCFWFLRSLPLFEQLESIDLGGVNMMDQHSLDDLMDLPVAPKLSGMKFSSTYISSFEQPIFCKKATKLLRSFQMGLPGNSASMSLDLMNALSGLQALQSLHVSWELYNQQHYQETLSFFFQWLKRPDCSIEELTFEVNSYEGFEPQIVFPQLSQVPMLKTLRLVNYDELDTDIEPFSQFLRDSPTVELVYLNKCKIQRRRQKLLELQLQCRPRLITILLNDEHHAYMDNELEMAVDEERSNHIALLYRRLRAYCNFVVSKPIPVSAWPVLLEKLGNTARYPGSVAVQEAGISAIYEILPNVLLNCMNWKSGKKRKRE